MLSLQGYAWIIAVLLLILMETGTPGLFYFLSFAVGALAAAIVAFLGINFYIQCSLAVIVSIVAFFFIKLNIKPFTKTKHRTNTDALMNKEATVIEPVFPNKTGRIKIKGEEWPAVTNTNYSFAIGTTVIIIGLEGNKLIIKGKS